MTIHVRLSRAGGGYPPCASVAPVNAITRLRCGRLFFAAAGQHPPGYYGVSEAADFLWKVGGTLTGKANLRNDPATYAHPSGAAVNARGRLAIMPPGQKLVAGYIQAAMGWSEVQMRPGVGFRGPGGAAGIQFGVFNAALNNYDSFLSGTGTGGHESAYINKNAGILALEIRPADKLLRGWGSNGVDPAIAFQSDAPNIYQGIGTFGAELVADNDNINGFTGTMSYGDVAVCRQRAIDIVNGPANGSVRLTVNGVVQTFASAAPYLNLDAAGSVSFDPAAGIWFPAAVRYEFFSAPALGGVLVADLTVPLSWGGDRIGAP